jgi:hypothetical protein
MMKKNISILLSIVLLCTSLFFSAYFLALENEALTNRPKWLTGEGVAGILAGDYLSLAVVGLVFTLKSLFVRPFRWQILFTIFLFLAYAPISWIVMQKWHFGVSAQPESLEVFLRYRFVDYGLISAVALLIFIECYEFINSFREPKSVADRTVF